MGVLAKNTILASLLAFTVSSFVYFGFANVYSSGIFSREAFLEQFHSGVYQYRILSGYLLMGIYHFLGSLPLDYSMFRLQFINPGADPRMFLSFYILNTTFTILSAVALVLLSHTQTFVATSSERLLIPALGIFTIALSQFVIVPYDCSSYFLMLLFFLIFLKYTANRSTGTFIMLCVIMLVSTLNRESSALSLSLAATLLYRKSGFTRQSWIPLAVLTSVFVLTYAGMRFTGNSFTTNDGNLLRENFSDPKNLLGLLFWGVFFMLSLNLAAGKPERKNILLFHLLAAPYLLMCIYTGILYEIRLYIPLFLSAMTLGRIKVK